LETTDAGRTSGLQTKGPGLARVTIRFITGLIIQGVLLFGSAGTWRWTEAWIYLVFVAAYGASVITWLARNNPDLLTRRSTVWKSGARPWDKAIHLAGIPLSLALFVVPALDVVRWRYSVMPLTLKGIGFGLFVIAMMMIFRVMKENAFLSRFVEANEQEGHRVITTGPYQIVRHPMYASAMLGFFSFSTALGSWIGFIPSVFLSALLLVRIPLEERVLLEHLEGYDDYMGKVRYRLIHGVW
jgi:protein-S-isoprenylcysteine O-methyltransferase Ste14